MLSPRRTVVPMRTFVLMSAALMVTALLVIIPPPAHADALGDRLTVHRDRLGVTSWHAAGYFGRGIKVAVLDGDFYGYKKQRGESLPWNVVSRSFRDDEDLEAGSTGHGLRTAQVVHALAPRAELLLVNWEPSRPESFFEAVRWAREQGARIFSCSVTAATWGDGDGGGPNHARLRRLLGDGDGLGQPLFFCSAGNIARGHWGGAFQRGKGGLHRWKPGLVDNRIVPEDRGPIRVSLLHKPGSVYEIEVFEGESAEPLTTRISEIDGSLAATYLTFSAKAGPQYRLRLRLVGGKPGAFHCIVRPGKLSVSTQRDSVCCFPADSPAVVTVGAADWLGRRMFYSAFGPAERHKPDAVAPVPFPCPDRPHGFHGTSAAAPQAAGLAALLWEKQPRWKARQIREALLAGLRPLSRGESGALRLWLPRPR